MNRELINWVTSPLKIHNRVFLIPLAGYRALLNLMASLARLP
jgi:hypothetical protein